jgi:fructose-bisphosphate aldolase class II
MPLVKMTELLQGIKHNAYAVGSFNVSNMEMGNGSRAGS